MSLVKKHNITKVFLEHVAMANDFVLLRPIVPLIESRSRGPEVSGGADDAQHRHNHRGQDSAQWSPAQHQFARSCKSSLDPQELLTISASLCSIVLSTCRMAFNSS